MIIRIEVNGGTEARNNVAFRKCPIDLAGNLTNWPNNGGTTKDTIIYKIFEINSIFDSLAVKGYLEKYQKVSKCYENDCRS